MTTIVDGTPAYLSDILPGDILISVNDVPIAGNADFTSQMQHYRGQAVDFIVIRGADKITKKGFFGKLTPQDLRAILRMVLFLRLETFVLCPTWDLRTLLTAREFIL